MRPATRAERVVREAITNLLNRLSHSMIPRQDFDLLAEALALEVMEQLDARGLDFSLRLKSVKS